MIKNCLFTLSLFVVLVGNGIAQIRRADGRELSVQTVDSIITRLMDTAGVTGLCLGVVKDNKVAYVKAYGYKNKKSDALNDTSTCFYGASLAKAVFAYLVMQLVEQGVIELDKPLYTYLPRPLPEYPNYKDLAADDRWKLITARHCLDHTTGFPNWRFFNPHGNQKLEIFFTPGERYAYSGEGLVLLQMVIETKTGRTLEELAQERLFRPAGMWRTSYLWQPAFENDYAVGHNGDEDTIPKNRRTKVNAAGSMETTIADYSRFVARVMQGTGLSEHSKQEMLKPQIGIFTKHQFPSLNTDTTDANRGLQLSYGLGWGLFISPAGKAFFKEGHDDGWQHYSICFPDAKVAFVLLSNSDNAERIYKELTQRLTGVDIPWTWEGYMPYLPSVNLPEAKLRQWVGEYDGRARATVFLENGRLRVKAADIPTMTLYPENDEFFFLRRSGATVAFVRGADGVVKAVVDDEGERYELTKIDGNPLLGFEGAYSAGGDNSHMLVVTVQEGKLFVMATSPADRLPKLELRAAGGNEFYLKEAPLKFRFVKSGDGFNLVTYGGPGKEMEWMRMKAGL